MPKPSPQLILSAAASALALAALALNAPMIGEASTGLSGPVPMEAGFEFPSLPALPAILPQ